MKKFFGLFIILFCLFLLALPSKACAQNMLLNSSFELWIDSVGIRMPFAWYTSEANDSGSATRTTDMHTGIFALKLTGSDTLAYAMTLSLCTTGHNYCFSGWTKSTSFIAGSFIITWLKLSQEPLMDPVIIPILRNTSYHNYTQIVQAPDSAVLVNVDVIVLPDVTINVDDITLRDTVLTGIEESRVPLSAGRKPLEIYPNPTKHILNVISQVPMTDVKLYDVSGMLVNHNTISNHSIDISGFKAGIYFVKLTAANKKIIEKFIVQR